MNSDNIKSTGLLGLSALIIFSANSLQHLDNVQYKPAYSFNEEVAEKLKDNSIYSYASYDKENAISDEIILDSPNMTYESFLELDQSNWF